VPPGPSFLGLLLHLQAEVFDVGNLAGVALPPGLEFRIR
jgi:hypothetical protein